MVKKYIVNLTQEQRNQLHELIRRGKTHSRKVRRAHTLLLADEHKADSSIAEMLHISPITVERTRKKFVQWGLEQALCERPRPGQPRKLNGRQEAFVVALACSEPPQGRKHWTMQLLADKVVELGMVDSISDETIRLRLKKNETKPWQRQQWSIPKVDGEFV